MAPLLKRTANGPELSKSLFSDLFDIDRFFDRPFNFPVKMAEVPMVNVKDEEDQFILELAAPGMTKKDFDIEVDNHYLTISYEKEEEEKEEKKNYTRREYNYDAFCRTFTLPEDVEEDKIDAKYDNGILKVMLPKKEEAKAKPKKKHVAIK